MLNEPVIPFEPATEELYSQREGARQTVAVTGSRGLVGSELVPALLANNYNVIRLVTGSASGSANAGTTWIPWKPEQPLPTGTLDGVDSVIHLAGDNVADQRWNETKKRKILESRTIPTRHIAEAIAATRMEVRPKTLICASAVGFYGSRGDEELTEESATGTGYFPDVVRAWEAACDPARAVGIRVVNMRVGVVLTPHGGALGKQLLPFKLCAGAVLGSGKQWLPWITIGDIIGATCHCLKTVAVRGPVNMVAPNPVTNRDFTRTLSRVLRRPAFLWLPRLVLRLMFGEFAEEGLLASIKARPAKLQATGYHFNNPDLEGALRLLLGR